MWESWLYILWGVGVALDIRNWYPPFPGTKEGFTILPLFLSSILLLWSFFPGCGNLGCRLGTIALGYKHTPHVCLYSSRLWDEMGYMITNYSTVTWHLNNNYYSVTYSDCYGTHITTNVLCIVSSEREGDREGGFGRMSVSTVEPMTNIALWISRREEDKWRAA